MGNFSFTEPKFRTLVKNGPSENRYDIVIIGDGYKSDEQSKFNKEVDLIVNEFKNTEPFKTYWKHFNFHRVNAISTDSGIDDPFAANRQIVNTPIDSGFVSWESTGRRIEGNDLLAQAIVGFSGVSFDGIIVLCNTKIYGGAVGALNTASGLFPQVCYVSAHSEYRNGDTITNFPRTAMHEASHAFAHLADEYSGGAPDCCVIPLALAPAVALFPNVDTNAHKPKWRVWLTNNVALPTPLNTPDDTIGSFEGGFFSSKGIYRPMKNCLMRKHEFEFCPICKEQWIKTIYEKTNVADSFSPPYNFPYIPLPFVNGANVRFKANVLRSQKIETRWSNKKLLDINWVVRQTTGDYADFTSTFDAGILGETWQVKCELIDKNAAIRDSKIRRNTIQEFVWNLFVSPQSIINVAGTAHDITEGTYKIRSAPTSDKYLDVNRGANGEIVRLDNLGNLSSDNKWRIKRVGGLFGGYTIESDRYRGYYIDADYWDTGNGGCKVQLWNRAIGDRRNQEWFIESKGNGKFRIKNVKSSNMVIDANDGLSSGSHVKLYNNSNRDHTQEWIFE